jgi:hypothetical protein
MKRPQKDISILSSKSFNQFEPFELFFTRDKIRFLMYQYLHIINFFHEGQHFHKKELPTPMMYNLPMAKKFKIGIPSNLQRETRL